MKSLVVLIGLLASSLAQADLRVFKGENAKDKTPCVVEEVQVENKTAFQVTGMVERDGTVYGSYTYNYREQTLHFRQVDDYRKEGGIYRKIKGTLNVHRNGFGYQFTGAFSGYEGKASGSAHATLDVSKGTFQYVAKEVQHLDATGGFVDNVYNAFFPAIKSKESLSCVKLVLVK